MQTTAEYDFSRLKVCVSPTHEATNSLGSVSIQESERDKFEDELNICNQLLNKVRGYFGFNPRNTRSKAAQNVTHADLEKSMKVNAVVALEQAQSYAAICEKRVTELEAQNLLTPDHAVVKDLNHKIKVLNP